MNEREYKVGRFLRAIARGEWTVDQLKKLVAHAQRRGTPCPTRETLNAIAAAEEAVARIEAEAERINIQQNDRKERQAVKEEDPEILDEVKGVKVINHQRERVLKDADGDEWEDIWDYYTLADGRECLYNNGFFWEWLE